MLNYIMPNYMSPVLKVRTGSTDTFASFLLKKGEILIKFNSDCFIATRMPCESQY